MEHTPTPWDHDKANARRIVACVNACEGLKTEELEKMPGGLWKDVFVDSLDKDVLIDELKAQNARLLEALRLTVDNLRKASYLTDHEGGDYTEVYKPVINVARTVIAEAEKTTAP